MFVGYARASTKAQEVGFEAQTSALESAGCEKVFQDRGISGSKRKRPGLDAALAALRPGEGAQLGNRTNLSEAQALGRARLEAQADEFAQRVLPEIQRLQASGVTGARAIAAALNARGIRTARGGEWHHSTVRNLLARQRQ